MNTTVPEDNSSTPKVEMVDLDKMRAGTWLYDQRLSVSPLHVEAVAESRTAAGEVPIFVSINGVVTPVYLDPMMAPFQKATKAEIDLAEDAGRRARMAETLRQMADLVQNGIIPIGQYPRHRHSQETRAELVEVGRKLGVAPVRQYKNSFEVQWPANARHDDFQVEFSAYYSDEEMAAEGLSPDGTVLPVKPTPAVVSKARAAKATAPKADR